MYISHTDIDKLYTEDLHNLCLLVFIIFRISFMHQMFIYNGIVSS